MGNVPPGGPGANPGNNGANNGNNEGESKDDQPKRKRFDPKPPLHNGRRRKKKGPATAIKTPQVFPTSKCKLRLLKLERIKVHVLCAHHSHTLAALAHESGIRVSLWMCVRARMISRENRTTF